MSASMVFSRGDLQAHGIWVWACFWFSVFVPRILEAVGRKDLRNTAPVRDRGAGADSALGTATSGFHPIVWVCQMPFMYVLCAVEARPFPEMLGSPHFY